MPSTSQFELTAGIRRAARLFPNRVATRCAARTRTWREFQVRIARLAAALRALGVAPGDRVAVLAHNSDYYVEIVFASLWAGAVAVPLNTRLALPELADCLADAEPVALVSDGFHADQASSLASGRANVLIVTDGDVPGGAAGYENLIEQYEPIADAHRGDDDLACLFYTGGTTGRSKGVMLSHANLVANSLVAISGMNMTERTVHLHVSPLFHIAGGARLFSVTLAGGTHVVMPRFEPVAFLRTVAEERVTLTIVVPTMLNQLLQAMDESDALAALDLSSLELLTYGASPMPEALLRRAFERLPGIRFHQGYGMTECSPLISMLAAEYHDAAGGAGRYLGSAGRPVCTAEVVILSPEGEALPPGAVGEVCVRGPMVMQGYWRMPDATAEALRGGWMHTGDAGYLDEDGFLFLVDRVKDMIVSGGENVYSAEVEAALHRHPDVLECAVVGVPDERWGEAVHAIVVPKPGLQIEPSALDATCRGLIAGFKCPKGYTLRTEPLPKSGAGKILKSELRSAFWHSQDRHMN